MQIQTTTAIRAPVLLLDPQMGRAHGIVAHLALSGFPVRIESTGSGALQAVKEAHFSTLLVIADLDDNACLDWLDTLRHAAARSWMIVLSPRCDTETRNLVYRHGGDACMSAPPAIEGLIRTLRVFERHTRPL